MSDFSQLEAATAELLTQVSETETVEASAKALIDGFADQVITALTAALEADANADNASIAAAIAAVRDVQTRLGASEDALGAAVLAGTPSAPSGPTE